VGELLAGLGQGQDTRVIERDLRQRHSTLLQGAGALSAGFVLSGRDGTLGVCEGLVDDADGDTPSTPRRPTPLTFARYRLRLES
jgi:hypothetical protein